MVKKPSLVCLEDFQRGS